MKLANILATATANAITALVNDSEKDIVAEAQRQANETISKNQNALRIVSQMKPSDILKLQEKFDHKLGASEIAYFFLCDKIERNLKIAFNL